MIVLELIGLILWRMTTKTPPTAQPIQIPPTPAKRLNALLRGSWRLRTTWTSTSHLHQPPPTLWLSNLAEPFSASTRPVAPLQHARTCLQEFTRTKEQLSASKCVKVQLASSLDLWVLSLHPLSLPFEHIAVQISKREYSHSLSMLPAYHATML